jgi:glyoxylase-like metal-dependent hydrolase (beta-lactamase superfamily II)
VDLAEVDTVLLTHLHIDHVGWLADGGLFGRAQHLLHADALAFALEHSRLDWLRRELRTLDDGGRITTIAGDAEIAPGVSVTALSGHYAGHLGVRLTSGGSSALVIADAAVHPALLDRPDLRYVSDHEHEAAVRTRRVLVDELVDSPALVVSGHYPGSGVGRIVRLSDRVVWEPV